ncbi:MAG: integration host factor subunit beta [Syntrophales bacterium]|nr:integration host factor subunit beta [Syntrophales bacterium]
MKKTDLMKKLALTENLSEKVARDIVNLVFDGFIAELKNGGRIEIRGFGTFAVRAFDTYVSTNPQNGKKMMMKRRRKPAFKVGKDLREKVDGKYEES